jgi:hypothetical protein
MTFEAPENGLPGLPTARQIPGLRARVGVNGRVAVFRCNLSQDLRLP